MCKLEGYIGFDSCSGYKVALRNLEKYYSPTTGIEYKEGAVTVPERQQNSVPFILDDLLEEGSNGYSREMVGRTCIILDYKKAKELLEDWQDYCERKLVLLEMRISTGLMYGRYASSVVIAGKNILAICEID